MAFTFLFFDFLTTFSHCFKPFFKNLFFVQILILIILNEAFRLNLCMDVYFIFKKEKSS